VILEGIVTTLDENGRVNIAPMGPDVEPDFSRFVLKPFRSSHTYQNLKRHGEGVLHVTDDVLLLARSAVGEVVEVPTRAAEHVSGQVLLGSCRYYEFRVIDVDEREERARFVSESVHSGCFRDFFGFNRAKHAVLETAILATRVGFSPLEGIASELEKYRLVVRKTGGPREAEAFGLLSEHIRSVARERGFDTGAWQS
jgi:uncharacterized protein